ncbi:MAG: hypothetical protein GTO63_25925, partial [Anaerolineae bacterium]|nr:hypothetical protein [Anaerolineae bacterium]NIN98181.1 hypothetical protein [Anaerolineae bacterium]NIQ81104.1 hypothetical protein [Anaerolineae bacterium]
MGLVVGYLDEDDCLWIGASAYNEKAEKKNEHPFNVGVALHTAIRKARKVTSCTLAPRCLPE